MANHTSAQTVPPNIFVIGAQCSGKTTLLKGLQEFLSHPENCKFDNARSFDPPAIIHEVVRGVMKDEGFSAKDIGTERWQVLQFRTLQVQCLSEEKLQDQWFISDRSGLDPIAYSELQGGSADTLRTSVFWMASRQRMREGLVILCEAGNQDWFGIDDARLTYSDLEDWHDMNRRFINLLEEAEIRFCILRKSVTNIVERVDFVMRNCLILCNNMESKGGRV